jgi:hypothetical protein
MRPVLSGHVEGMPYSFSRWTDVPAAKWAWFCQAMREGKMIAFDPRNAIPYEWSLAPEDTLGMVFWTKDPATLTGARDLLAPYRVKVHVTLTGWHEVERGVPSVEDSTAAVRQLSKQIGRENVVWRFSPVPLVDNPIARFRLIASKLEGAVDRVYLSFLQTNDMIPETRDTVARLALMVSMAEIASSHGIRVLLCNEDRTLARVNGLPDNLSAGVCAPPEDFNRPGLGRAPSEGCGCVLMVDAFTINETCVYGCQYCYAADKTLAPKKRNTTRGLPVLR